MEDVITSDVWDINVIVSQRQRVVFETPVTAKMALKLFERGQYEDVIDTEDYAIEEIVGIDD